MKKLFISFAALAALLSCVKETPQNEQESINQNTEVEGKVVSIIANAPSHVDANASSNKPQQSGTRTQLASDGKSVLWSPGDVVKVCFEPPYSTASSNSQIKHEVLAELTVVNAESSNSAMFTGTWNASAPMYSVGVIVYPASVNFTSSQSTSSRYVTTNVSYNLPAVQEAIEGSFADNLNLSYAPVTYTQLYNNNPNVTFKNVCSLIRINLPQTNYNIKSIKIESGNGIGIMAGNAKLEWSTSSTSTGLKFNSTNAGISESTPVTLSKADGSDLIPGASYYVVVWPSTHNKLDFTFTDANGKTCVKTVDPGWVYCDAGKCVTVNVKSLDFSDAAPFLNVGITSVEVDKRGAEESFVVTANNPVTVSVPNNVGWLSASYVDGQCVLTTQPNKESGSRSTTISLSSAGITKTVTVTQTNITYSRTGSALVRASYLENGKKYVATRNSNRDQYWYNNNGTLVVSTYSNSAALPSGCVFVFEKDNNKYNGPSYGYGSGYKYSYMSAGAWKSAYNDQYLNHSFYFGSTAYYFTILSGWHSGSAGYVNGEDFDIYKSDTNNELMDCQYSFKWGNTGNYKWSFYEVVENE